MNSRHLESHNLTTPMGTIPISVIYGFEYPCQSKSSTRRHERSELVQVTSSCRVGESDNLKMKHRTRGCLTEIKKYRKPNLISSTAHTISVTRVNRSGTETRTHHCLQSFFTSKWCLLSFQDPTTYQDLIQDQ